MSEDFVPHKDDRFHVWANVLWNYIAQHYSFWNIPPMAFSNVDMLHNAFEVAYAKTENPDHKKSETHDKTAKRKVFEKALREFLKSFVTYNPEVTDVDRDQMGLPIHKPNPEPSPIPDLFPVAEVDSSIPRQLTIHFRNEHSKSKAKPFGVHGAEIRWAILDMPPTSVDEIVNSVFCTNSPYTFVFGEEDRGKRVYFCMRWENTRGEKGPWGEIFSAIIP
jgi:hypothetical protein